MGILHSTTRFFGRKPSKDDEEFERPIYPHPLLSRRNSKGDSFEKLHKMLTLGCSIYNFVKRLLQKFRFIFSLQRERTRADPLLPVQNPASTVSSEPLLVQTTLISSPIVVDSSPDSFSESGHHTFAFVADDFNTDDEKEMQSDSVDVLSSQQWWLEETESANYRKKRDNVHPDSFSESGHDTFAFVADDLEFDDEKEMQSDNVGVLSSQQWWPAESESANYRKQGDDHVIVSIPDFTYSFSNAASASEEIISSAVFLEENAPRDVPFVEESLGMNSTEADEGREEDEVEIKSVIVVGEERWIKHYSSRHRILLVGEGDFSFSACLAVAFGFGFASNVIATSLDSEAFLKENYPRAQSNIKKLRSRGSRIMHEVDATKMANDAMLGPLKFDRVIFNFPYADLKKVKNLPRESQLRRHRRLVSLFLKNAREMIRENGEIHISHKINDFHVEFMLESIASSHRLRLIEAVKFNRLDYPGYKTKCGFGGDRFFKCNPSKTYKFGLKGVRY